MNGCGLPSEAEQLTAETIYSINTQSHTFISRMAQHSLQCAMGAIFPRFVYTSSTPTQVNNDEYP
jgi:hypothetical protein